MKIVKISDLSENEKKKIQERQAYEIQTNKENRTKVRKQYASVKENQNQNLTNKNVNKSNLISEYGEKVKNFINTTSNNIGEFAMKYADGKRISNQYEKYKMPSTDEEKQQIAIEQAKKQTQNSEQQVSRKKSIEEYNRIKKEREAQAIVSEEELLENLSKMPAYKRTAEIYNITKNNNDFNNLNNQVIQLQTIKKANKKANKINEDFSNKKYLSSLAHIAKGVPIKARDSVTTTMSAINSLANSAGVVDVPTNSYIKSSGDDLLKVNKSVTNEYGLTSSQINNGTVRTASNVSGTIGNMAPSILASAILPGSGRALQAVQVGADSYQENLNDDSSNRLKSVLTGLSKGYASYAIEGLSGGNILSTGSLDDWAVKTIANKTSNKSLQKLASMIYEVGGEVLEEEVENHVDYAVDKIINNKDFPEFKDWWNETSETAKQTILSTLTLKVLGLGGNTFKDVQEYSQNADMYKWINEAEKIIDKENLKIDTSLQQNNINNQVILPTQQITPTENKSAQNGFSEQIINDNSTPMLNYQYEISDNKKINNLRQDANKYFNNTEKARNYVSMLEQIISDKDIDIRLDSNLKTADGRVANGSYSNGVITINPNSTKTGEFIAVHELTHAIGTDSMKSIIDTYRKSNIDFDNSVKSLLENYSTTELTDEALADVSAQLFGNQEFINNVSQNNPSVFKKIYNEIKYLWHQFRGYKNQDQFIDDLYYKWTQAYNSSNKLNETTNYYIEPVAKFNEVEYNNIIEERLDKREYSILRSIINSDSNIKPGINYVEVTNGRYIVYYKGVDDFKVMSRKVDADAGRINERNDKTRGKTRYSEAFEQSVRNRETTASNDEVSDFNTQRTYKRSGSNTSSSANIENGINGKLFQENDRVSRGGKNDAFLEEDYQNIENKDIQNQNQDIGLVVERGRIKYAEGKKNGGSYGFSKKNISKNTKQNMGLVDGRKRGGHVDNYEIYQDNMGQNSQESSGLVSKRTSGNNRPDGTLGNWRIENSKKGKKTSKKIQEIDTQIQSKNGKIEKTTYGSEEKNNRKVWNNRRLEESENNSGSFSLPSNSDWQTYLDTNFKSTGTKTNLEDIKGIAPIAEKTENTIKAPISSEKQRQMIQNKLNIEIQQATQNKTSKGAIRLGKVTENISQRIKTLLGINVENRTHILSDNDIRHMLNEHGDPIKESKNGQIAITTEDISKIPEIINSYDDIIKGSTNKNGETIRYIKKFEDGITYMVEVVPENSKTLNIKTMWKKPTTLTNNQQIPSSTSLTTDSPISSTTNTIITQNNPNMQEKNTPLRTSEQIANDSKISDLEAIKEESSKINTPTLQKVNDTSNNISGNIPPDNTPQSPTIDLVNKKRSKEKASLSQIKDTLAQKFINKGHYIDKLAKQTGNKNLTYLYDRTMNTFNEAQISIGDKQVITNASGNDIEVVGKSIIDIFSEADKSNLSNEFDDYLLNKHNISRYAYEKGVFGKEISATDSQNTVNSYEKQHPEFIKWSKEVSQYNDNNLKDLVNNGLVSKEIYNKLRVMYEDYVPTFRDITENMAQFEDNFIGGNTLKKATQSDKSILSVKESMAEQTLAIKKAIRMNKLGVELYNTLGKNTKVNESVKGIEFDPVAIQTIAGDVISKAKDGTNTFMIFQDGVMTEFKISDELYSAFSKDTLQSKINNSDVAKTLLTPVEKLSKAQRELLTTYSIGFAFNNPIKDFQDALFNTKYSSSQFLKNYTKSLYNIAVDGSWYQNYKGNGGTANTYFDYETGILPNKNIKFGDAIKKANNILEQAPRLAEYISTIENGGSVDEALYNSADITTNFKRGGDITKVVNKYGANFLNASVQGLDKFYRNLTGQSGWKGYANLAVKATVWQVAPAILNGLLLGDDDDYEVLPEYTKDNYFLFKMNDGKFFRIPKGRVSSVVGGIARRALESFQSKDVDWNALIDTAVNQMAPNNPLSDNILAPIIQAKTNKAWYGGDIVSSRLQKLPNAEQFDESTDKLSKFLGEKLNISPKKINYVLDQYSGGIGDVVLPMLTPQAENNILEDKFTTDSVMKNKHVSEYYSLLDELEKNKNSANATNEDLLKYKYLSDSSSDISELYQKKRAIQNSDLSDEEKKTQVREVQKQINDIIENKLENVDSVKVNNNTASIGNNKYYKYKDEWKVVSDKEAKKIKGISLNTYADYQNKVAKLYEEKKKSDESVSQKDKIKILANSNWTTNEKDKIYTQIINDDDETYAVLKKLDSSKSIINQYLDYLQNDFKADREDDGTEKGKAVSGSKKKKVYTYINGIDSNNMSYVQKLYLTGVNTSLSSSDKKKIVDYINKSNSFSKKEKLEAIDKLQGVTVYKDGRISW